jgi:hypothetical protein
MEGADWQEKLESFSYSIVVFAIRPIRRIQLAYEDFMWRPAIRDHGLSAWRSANAMIALAAR